MGGSGREPPSPSFQTARPSSMNDEGRALLRLKLCFLLSPSPSVRVEFRDCAVDIFDLREYRVFESGRVCDECVERGDAADGRVEVLEQLFGDARGEFRPEAVRARVLVGDDDLVGLA